MADQRFAAPVLADGGKEPVFDLVPLARPWRKMADCDVQTRLIRQFLQLPFLQPYPRAFTAAGVGRDQQLPGLGITSLAHRIPPATDALHCKSRRVMIHSHIYPTAVLPDSVDPLRSHFAPLLDLEIMHAHLFWFSLGPQFPPAILEIPNQLFLLRVYRDHRLSVSQTPLDPSIDVFKLRVAVRMLGALQHLAVGLQAIIHSLEQFRYGLAVGRMSPLIQLLSQVPHALAGPT